MVIDGDGHCNEPRDLFDRYLEKEFRERGPKVVNAHGMRWMIEGKFLPRPVGTWGHGTSSGYFGTNMAKKGMATTTQSLDDVSGRLRIWIRKESTFKSSIQYYSDGVPSR